MTPYWSNWIGNSQDIDLTLIIKLENKATLIPSSQLFSLPLFSLQPKLKHKPQLLPCHVPFSTQNVHIKENQWSFATESILSQMKDGTGQFGQSEFLQEKLWLSILRWI